MAEFAVSLTFLILAFSGAIDLGRAFFTRIILDSAVSEGAHWVAAYPGCVAYGASFGDMSNVVNAPGSCQGTNSIFQRIRNESSLLLPGNVTGVWLTKPSNRATMDLMQPGDTITISASYNVVLLTPTMRGMFGDTLGIQVDVQEVVRGTNLPPTTGKPSTFTNSSTVQTVQLVTTSPTSPIQTDGTSSACANGYVRFQFKEPASGTRPTRYMVYEADSGTGALGTQVANITSTALGALKTVTVVAGAGIRRIPDDTDGGNQLYGIQSELDSGSPTVTTKSDIIYILTSCPLVQPTLSSYTCTTGTPSPSVTFTWSMNKTYAWSGNIAIDTNVNQYRLFSVDTVTLAETLVTSWNTSGGVTTGADAWTLSNTTAYTFSGGPTDPLRTGTFRLWAANSSTGVYGKESDNATELVISCP